MGMGVRLNLVGWLWGLFAIFAAYFLLVGFVAGPWLYRTWQDHRSNIRNLSDSRNELARAAESRRDEFRRQEANEENEAN